MQSEKAAFFLIAILAIFSICLDILNWKYSRFTGFLQTVNRWRGMDRRRLDLVGHI